MIFIIDKKLEDSCSKEFGSVLLENANSLEATLRRISAFPPAAPLLEAKVFDSLNSIRSVWPDSKLIIPKSQTGNKQNRFNPLWHAG